ncbi:hypothetical protein [Helicobacter macacae]|uniref:Uncharacterized protein n=1 Tax=Helicobacter macacae MIT 99-5501 TaxID=1357400 RepID=V8CCZ6_9HELI|nr:hypothetical protein [Helicobacter macacae]ETD25234.1 hypothetical protein HMPREF2086_00569 [Helicobacter macacae MIT 99-5501]
MKQIISILEPCSFVGISVSSVQTPQATLTTPAPSVQKIHTHKGSGLSVVAGGIVFGGLGSKIGIR